MRFEEVLKKGLEEPLSLDEAIYLLNKARTWDRILELMKTASRVRDEVLGPRIKVMGFVASVTPCTVDPWCKYCFRWARRDLFAFSDVLRPEEIVEALKIVESRGIKSVELGGGTFRGEWGRIYTLNLVRTLCRELPRMRLWLNNGPSFRLEDLHLMKGWGLEGVACNFETLNEMKYVELRPGLSLRERIEIVEECDRVGLGIDQTLLIGLGDRGEPPYEEWARFMHYLRRFRNLRIVEVHPFRPVWSSPCERDRPGSWVETLKMIAVARLMLRSVEISGAHTPWGIMAGASLVMHALPVTRAFRAWERSDLYASRIIRAVNDVVIVDNLDEYTRAAREMGLEVEPL